MLKDSIKPLRETVAWILIGAVGVEFLVGLWDLFEPAESDFVENWFFYNSYYATTSFVSLPIAVMLVAALLVATVLPDRLERAKPIVLIVAIETGVLMLFGILTMFLGLFYEQQSSSGVTSIGPDGVDKAQNFIGDLPSLALTVIPLLLALAMLRSTDMFGGPKAPQQGGYYGQPQQPYPGQPFPPQQPQQAFPPQQQGYPPQQPQQYPGSFPEWGGPPQQGGYGQGW